MRDFNVQVKVVDDYNEVVEQIAISGAYHRGLGDLEFPIKKGLPMRNLKCLCGSYAFTQDQFNYIECVGCQERIVIYPID